jgi:hypothetical protein
VFLWLLSLAQAKESNSPKGEKERGGSKKDTAFVKQFG